MSDAYHSFCGESTTKKKKGKCDETMPRKTGWLGLADLQLL